MITRNIPISEFKVGFDDRFNPETDDWIGRLDRWIIKAIRGINTELLFNPVSVIKSYEDNLLLMPVDLEILTGIVVDGTRLLPDDNVHLNPNDTSEETTTYYLLGSNKTDDTLLVDKSNAPIEVKLPKITTTYTRSNTVTEYSYTYTVMKNNVIRLNVPESSGEVSIYFKSLPYGMVNGAIELLIPQNEELISALEWYVLARLIGRGYQHHVFDYKYAISSWYDERKKAKGSINAFSLDQREAASRHFRQFVTDYNHWGRMR